MMAITCLLRGFCTRHPKRFLFFIISVSITCLVWRSVPLNMARKSQSTQKWKRTAKPNSKEDNVTITSESWISPRLYVQIDDVAVQELTHALQEFVWPGGPSYNESFSEPCTLMAGICVGFYHFSINGRHVIRLVSNISAVTYGTATLYVKRELVAQISFGKDKLYCALPLSEQKRNNIKRRESSGCGLPMLDPFDTSVMDYVQLLPRLHCEGTSFTSYNDNTLKIIATHDRGAPVKVWRYQSILRPEGKDEGFVLGNPQTIKPGQEIKLPHDFIKVTAVFSNGATQDDYHAHVSRKEEVFARARETSGIPLNIIILGFDGNSDANIQRQLPDTYKYLKDELNGLMFKGFSLVGQATTPQLTALLTGKTLEENCRLHEARTESPQSGTLDKWPFIFKSLEAQGYVTLFSEDAPDIGAFNLRLNGFKEQPCDHYGRYFWLATPQNKAGYVNDACINARPQHQLQLQYLKSLFVSYPNTLKFGFTFIGSLCHQSLNSISIAAIDIHNFIKSLQDERYLNNTMLVVMSDHGARFGDVRLTLQGKLEERLPFLSIVLPAWFSKKYETLYHNLQHNTQRIITPLDLHATFMHILRYPQNPSKSNESMGVSLFEGISRNRSCHDAHVPEYFCPCKYWKPISTTHAHVRIAAELAILHINKQLSAHKHVAKLCQMLKLEKVMSAMQEIPNLKMHSFDKIKNGDGLGIGVPLFKTSTDTQSMRACRYQVTIKATPGGGIFETTAHLSDGKMNIVGEIARINKFGMQPRCIERSHPNLRKFCLCVEASLNQ